MYIVGYALLYGYAKGISYALSMTLAHVSYRTARPGGWVIPKISKTN